MNKIYKTKTFNRWMNKTDLTDQELLDAVDEMQRGLVDADLGNNLYKKRVALAGAGKRSGARTIVATRYEGRWFFLFGFSKNERDNISDQERKALQLAGQRLLSASDEALLLAVEQTELFEVVNHD
jgi:hypothetical protein